ncbi:MAG: cytochrome c-type biosis protein CcmH, partial [Alphaproteobacteria bacterium]|nr:cytochrome c-type biosis protein CcmH [Alphaproteobacteria bacterium]
MRERHFRFPAKAGTHSADRAGPRRSPGNLGALFLALILTGPALAQSALPPSHYAYTQLEDARQEAQAKALMESLRCLVCQGQS